ncbi:hypothetical protein AB0B85_32885 [Micromonospora sp. NPDC049044]|uniref:hypothetical protein n=1 Tax=Micromonospora sp. NPDC049044 TaxID=3154827 RepID=UPI0033F080CA
MGHRIVVVLATAALLGGCTRPEPHPAPDASQATPVNPTPTTVTSAASPLPGFVVLTDLDPRIHADIRYATAYRPNCQTGYHAGHAGTESTAAES